MIFERYWKCYYVVFELDIGNVDKITEQIFEEKAIYIVLEKIIWNVSAILKQILEKSM